MQMALGSPPGLFHRTQELPATSVVQLLTRCQRDEGAMDVTELNALMDDMGVPYDSSLRAKAMSFVARSPEQQILWLWTRTELASDAAKLANEAAMEAAAKAGKIPFPQHVAAVLSAVALNAGLLLYYALNGPGTNLIK